MQNLCIYLWYYLMDLFNGFIQWIYLMDLFNGYKINYGFMVIYGI